MLSDTLLSFPPGKKCTYGVKCKYYHPERSNQSQLSVADELRAKTKPVLELDQPGNIGPSSPGQAAPSDGLSLHGHNGHFYSSPPLIKAPTCQEDHPCRLSPSKQPDSCRDSSSPVRSRSSPTCQSFESDEAFGAPELSVSHLYFQEAESQELRQLYCRGPGSPQQSQCGSKHCCSSQSQQCRDSQPPEGCYHGSARWLQAGHNHNAFRHHQQAHGHCPSFGEPAHHMARRFAQPHAPWGVISLDPSAHTNCEQSSMTTQLGSIFPQSTVNMSELVPLIHRL